MNRQRTGMTLLEVIVALTVSAVALTAGAATLGFLADRQNQPGVQSIAAANAVRTQLREWLAAARLPTSGDMSFTGSARGHSMSDASADELTFLTSAITPVSTNGTIVHLYVAATGTGTHGLVASLRPWRESGPEVLVSLAAEASGLHAKYAANVNGPWQREWASASVLPAAINIEATFASSDSSRASRALLAMPMTVLVEARR